MMKVELPYIQDFEVLFFHLQHLLLYLQDFSIHQLSMLLDSFLPNTIVLILLLPKHQQ
jgi:hypothetical protein